MHGKPCRLGGPHRFRAGGKNQRWPTSGQGGYITHAAWEVPTASERGAESEVAAVRSGKFLFLGGHATKRGFQSGGTTSELAHKRAQWQSEVGKLIFWVSNLLSKIFFYEVIYLVKKFFFLLNKLLTKKNLLSNLLSRKPTPRGKT